LERTLLHVRLPTRKRGRFVDRTLSIGEISIVLPDVTGCRFAWARRESSVGHYS
jgi:hypothetical protein